MNGTGTIAEAGPYSYTSPMTATLIGYARCSTDRQDLAAQRQALLELGRRRGPHLHRSRPSPAPAVPGPAWIRPSAAVREDDTLVVPKLDRLARSVPDARAIAERLQEQGVKLALGRALYDPSDPMGKMFFNILATFAEFEADLIRNAHPRGHGHGPLQGEIAWQAAEAVRQTAAGTLPHACHRRLFRQRSRRTLLHLKTNRLSHTQPASFPLAYDSAPYRNRPDSGGPQRSSSGRSFLVGNQFPLMLGHKLSVDPLQHLDLDAGVAGPLLGWKQLQGA